MATTEYQIDAGTLTTYSTPFVVSTAGSHTITYYSTDAAGNQEATKTGHVNIDTTAPTTAATNLQVNGTTGWTNSSVTVTLTPSDTGGSGIAATKYQIDAGTLTTYSAPFVVSGAGGHTVTYCSTDAAGNAGDHQDRLRQHRHDGAAHHGDRPADLCQKRLDQQLAARHAVADRCRRFGPGLDDLLDRRRRGHALHGRLHRLRRRQPHDHLLLDRCRRQRRKDAHRLREHWRARAGQPARQHR